MTLQDLGLIFDEALILIIAIFLTVKGFALRRRLAVGRALARNNFAFAIAYYGIFLGTVIQIEFFRSDLWRWSIRTLIFLTLTHAIYELTSYYGGWKGLFRELLLTFFEFRDSWCEWLSMGCYRIRQGWANRWGRILLLLLIATLTAAGILIGKR